MFMAIAGTWLLVSVGVTAVLSVLARGAHREDVLEGYVVRGE
ncbi:hypothetical protein ACI8AF_00670 [Blastococcus sp. SYSU D00669]